MEYKQVLKLLDDDGEIEFYQEIDCVVEWDNKSGDYPEPNLVKVSVGDTVIYHGPFSSDKWQSGNISLNVLFPGWNLTMQGLQDAAYGHLKRG